MKVYIAGPIRNNLDFREDFHRGATIVRADGHEPVNPADAEYNDAGKLNYVSPMWHALDMMRTCNAIYLLNGWEDSEGARIEKDLAFMLGWPIFTEGSWPEPIIPAKPERY